MKAVAQSIESLTTDRTLATLAIGLYFAALREPAFWVAAAEALDRWAQAGHGFSTERLCARLHARQCRARARRIVEVQR